MGVQLSQQHYDSGRAKDWATGGRYKQSIGMFKAVRNQLVQDGVIGSKTAPSYFVECLLHNVPERLFRVGVGQTYLEVVRCLAATDPRSFIRQNRVQTLFGDGMRQWCAECASAFVIGLVELWNRLGN